MSAVTELTGLEKVRVLLATGGRPPIGERLEFSLVEVELGSAVFESVPGRFAYNPMGIVHGGYAATLLDSACGIATASMLDPGESFTTLELKVAYHRSMDELTGMVRAQGNVVTLGRRIAYCEAKLTDTSGRLLASASSTLLRIPA